MEETRSINHDNSLNGLELTQSMIHKQLYWKQFILGTVNMWFTKKRYLLFNNKKSLYNHFFNYCKLFDTCQFYWQFIFSYQKNFISIEKCCVVFWLFQKVHDHFSCKRYLLVYFTLHSVKPVRICLSIFCDMRCFSFLPANGILWST